MLRYVSDVVTVRRMTDEDDLAVVNAGNPMAWQAVWWQELSATMGVRWFIGLVDGVPAGFAAVCPLPVAAGGNGAAIVHVLPEYRRRGLGSALRGVVEDVARGQRPGLTYSYVEGEADSEAAARASTWERSTRPTTEPRRSFRESRSANCCSATRTTRRGVRSMSSSKPGSARRRTRPTGEATCPTSRFATWWTSRGCS